MTIDVPPRTVHLLDTSLSTLITYESLHLLLLTAERSFPDKAEGNIGISINT